MADFAIRLSAAAGWTYVAAEPKSSFREFGEEKFAGDGSRVEVGYVDITWSYDDLPLTGTEMGEFYGFCPGASASVQVRTKVREVTASGQPVFRIFQCIMYRPDVEFSTRHITQRFVNVSIRFRGSEELSE